MNIDNGNTKKTVDPRTNSLNSPASSTLLTVSDLAVEVGGRAILKNVNFKVKAGSLIELRGDNGSGKTTLLRYIAGIRHINSGQVDLHDTTYAYLGQKTSGNVSLTALEHIRWLVRIADKSVGEESLVAALTQVLLKKQLNKPLGTLSAGQARLCSLASLLVLKAQLWLLDEPLTALDEVAVSWLKAILGTHRERGGAAIVATHTSLTLADTEFITLHPE